MNGMARDKMLREGTRRGKRKDVHAQDGNGWDWKGCDGAGCDKDKNRNGEAAATA